MQKHQHEGLECHLTKSIQSIKQWSLDLESTSGDPPIKLHTNPLCTIIVLMVLPQNYPLSTGPLKQVVL